MNRTVFLTLCLGLILSVFACSTEVNINAPAKDIWVVYGILDASDSAQYLRISKGFQPESNALEYAKENDLAGKGLNVTVTAFSSGKVYEAIEIDSVLKNPADGTFYPYTTLYKLETAGGDALKEGERYDLKVTNKEDASLELRAYTYLPEEPTIRNPSLTACAGTFRGIRSLGLEKTLLVEWSRGNAKAWELRSYLAYKEDGVADTVDYGPTKLITENRGCASDKLICHRFAEKELLSTFLTKMDQQPGSIYTYVDSPVCATIANLPTAFSFEVTALDTFFTNYLTANDPKFQDFNTVRPEYTNLEGTELVFGLFGSISKAKGIAGFNDCTKYLLNLNETRRPFPSCEL